jgi:transcriptional regulator with XRE-family HTH domain
MISLKPIGEKSWVLELRQSMKMSQVEFGQLFGVHFMTVSRWERGILSPTPYQLALMEQFRKAAEITKAGEIENAKKLLVGAGVVAALLWLLSQ